MNVTGSAFTIPRPCLVCGTPFCVPRTAARKLTDFCSYECERRGGIPKSIGFYRTPLGPTAVIVEKPKLVLMKPPKPVREIKLDYNRSRFASKLIALRRRHSWSQRQLATQIGVHQNIVARWEGDMNSPSVELLARLASALNTTMDDLWRGTVD